MKTTIKTGDTVKVIAGDNKGKSAKVVKVAPKEDKAFLEGIGVKTRHLRPTQYQKGGKKDIHVGIHLSNLKLVEKGKEQPESTASPARRAMRKTVGLSHERSDKKEVKK